MVMSIIASFFAFILLVLNSSQLGRHNRPYPNHFHIDQDNQDNTDDFYTNVFCALQVLLGLVEIIVAITTSAFSCRAVCCRKRHVPGQVLYTANRSAEGFTNVNAPPDQPPDYEEITGAQALPENNGEKKKSAMQVQIEN